MNSKSHSGNFITIEPGIKRTYLLNEFRICATEVSQKSLESYAIELAETVEFSSVSGKHTIVTTAIAKPLNNQYDLHTIYVGNEGTIQVYYWRKQRLLTIDIHAHHNVIQTDKIAEITRRHFGLIESASTAVNQKSLKKENPQIEVRDNKSTGRGVFAKSDIKKGELIGGLYGKFHEAPDCMALPEQYRDHVMQCSSNLWRGNEFTHEAVQYLNHSCEPNSGVQGLFDFVAMRNIQAGEEITTDYAMQDDSNWVVPGGSCLCKADKCRGDIVPYRKLSEEDKEHYKNFISHWILHKYKICSCPQ